MHKILTIDETFHRLTSLNNILTRNDAHKLAAFNAAYLVVTKKFSEAIQKKFFHDPILMERLDAIFASYYFRAIEAHKPPPEWDTVRTRSVLEPSKLFSLLLGANVHINHDLPLALLECIQEPEIFESDYFRAQQLFKKSIQEILEVFIPKNFGYIRKKFILKYTTQTILQWRQNSWRNFLALKNDEITKADILKLTLAIAKRIQTQEKFLARCGIF